jgi:hypothetical protein
LLLAIEERGFFSQKVEDHEQPEANGAYGKEKPPKHASCAGQKCCERDSQKNFCCLIHTFILLPGSIYIFPFFAEALTFFALTRASKSIPFMGRVGREAISCPAI